MVGIYAVLIGATVLLFEQGARRLRADQDKQYLIGFAQLPDGATLDRTEDVVRRMGEIMLKHPGVDHVVSFPGLSINGFTQLELRHRVRPRSNRSTSARARSSRRRQSPDSSTRSSPRSPMLSS